MLDQQISYLSLIYLACFATYPFFFLSIHRKEVGYLDKLFNNLIHSHFQVVSMAIVVKITHSIETIKPHWKILTFPIET